MLKKKKPYIESSKIIFKMGERKMMHLNLNPMSINTCVNLKKNIKSQLHLFSFHLYNSF